MNRDGDEKLASRGLDSINYTIRRITGNSFVFQLDLQKSVQKHSYEIMRRQVYLATYWN